MNQFLAGRRLIAAGCSILFCVAIYLPIAAQITGLAPQGKLAEATSSPFPEFSWTSQSFTAMGKTLASGWLDKNYPFRGVLIRWYNHASATLFGTMSSNSPVAVGKDGWLYLARDRTLNVLDEHRALTPLTGAQLARLAAIFEERRAWCARHGIRYVVAVAPNKESVYPEHLPDEFRQVGPRSRMEQIMEYIRANTTLEVIDLKPAILEAKKTSHAPVFYATDSHWNARGAFPAYQEIIRAIGRDFPGLKPAPASDFFVQEFTYLGGDLSYMVGMEELITENKVYMLPKKPREARGASTDYFRKEYVEPAQASERPGGALPRAVFFHDSYFWELLPLLAEHFSRAVYVWLRPNLGGDERFFDKELILAEKPDVVVEQIAERFFIPAAVKGGASAEHGQ